MQFRSWLEAADIFGFDREKRGESPETSELILPIKQFDVEKMMDLLSRKRVGVFLGEVTFHNSIQWGDNPGSVKLEISPSYTFFVKKLAIDKEGNPRWVTNKCFQLNRTGCGGFEDSVAQEIYESIRMAAESNIEAAVEEYKDLDRLVEAIFRKLKRCIKPIFLPEGIKKLHEHAYIIKFNVRGQGVEARDHTRIEQNQVMVTYDEAQGTIRITDYNLLSKNGRGHEFRIGLNETEMWFMSSQSVESISNAIATKLRYF